MQSTSRDPVSCDACGKIGWVAKRDARSGRGGGGTVGTLADKQQNVRRQKQRAKPTLYRCKGSGLWHRTTGFGRF